MTFVFGALNVEYVIVFSFCLLLSMFILIRARKLDFFKILILTFLFVFSIILPMFIHIIQGVDIKISSLVTYMSPALVIIVASAISLYSPQDIRVGIGFSLVLHLMLLVAILFIPSLQLPTARLSTMNISTAALSEIALGVLIISLLFKNNPLILISAAISMMVQLNTEMRSTLILSFGLLVFYFYKNIVEYCQKQPFATLTILFSILIMLAFNVELLIQMAHEILMLDDPHRGLESGFSGRGERNIVGLENFLSNPLFGVGLNGEGVSAIHLGFLKAQNQYGLLFVLVLLFFIFRGSVGNYRAGNTLFLAMSFCFILFLLTSPRILNLQIFPFVAIYAIAYGYNHQKKSEFKQ